MERYGSITTPVSIPRFIVGGMLVGGVAVVAMAFLNYGLLAGTVVAAIPAALCILWVTLRNPALAMLGLFVINYFIMGLTRYAHDLPFGMILDALIFYNILIISLQAMMHRIEWKRASSGLTVVAAIWVAYCVLELTGSKSKIIRMPLPSDDPQQRKPDITLAHKMLGDWEPTIQLRDGLLKTIAYFEEVLSRGGIRR